MCLNKEIQITGIVCRVPGRMSDTGCSAVARSQGVNGSFPHAASSILAAQRLLMRKMRSRCVTELHTEAVIRFNWPESEIFIPL